MAREWSGEKHSSLEDGEFLGEEAGKVWVGMKLTPDKAGAMLRYLDFTLLSYKATQTDNRSSVNHYWMIAGDKWIPRDFIGGCHHHLRLHDGEKQFFIVNANTSVNILFISAHNGHVGKFHKSSLSSKKVNKFTLYNWKPYWWLRGFYISVFWVTN